MQSLRKNNNNTSGADPLFLEAEEETGGWVGGEREREEERDGRANPFQQGILSPTMY